MQKSKKGYNFFLSRMYFAINDGYQNFLVFAPILSSLILDSNKKVANWISTRMSSWKIKPFDTNLELTISNLANGRLILKFKISVLVQKMFSFYSNFLLNLHIVYELNNWPPNPTNNFPVKNCFLGTVKLVRNTIKSKFTYNGWGIAFDGEGLCSFDNVFARNLTIFVVDNTSSSHNDGIDINDSIGAAEKNSINFRQANTKFCLSLH